MRNQILATAFALVALLPAFETEAATRKERQENRHEIRISWGDQSFEKMMWCNPRTIVETMPESYMYDYKENYRYSQHWALDYSYNIAPWFSAGMMFDGSGVTWNNVTRNGAGIEMSRTKGENFYNLIFMPEFTFTYFHHKYVNLHSGIGAGLNVNGGSEVNAYGRHIEVAPVYNLNVFGVSANYQRWFMTVDLGCLISNGPAKKVYLLGSRMVSIGIGVRL